MQPGNRVRVQQSVVVFTHPENRGKAFDMKGQEVDGEEGVLLLKPGTN